LACIDSTSTAFAIYNYDESIEELEIRITNLRLFGGNPNQFCSCAISNFLIEDSQINYVAFVDSGTVNPVSGFDPFFPSASASNAWENIFATGDWNGFVSEVNQNGLLPNVPVELVVRIGLFPPQSSLDFIFDMSELTSIGTDEWDANADNLANSHQNFFTDINSEFVEVDASYFDILDGAIISSVPDLQLDFQVYPSISSDIIQINSNSINFNRLVVYDISGSIIMENAQLNSSMYVFNISSIANGIYFLRLETDDSFGVQEFVKY